MTSTDLNCDLHSTDCSREFSARFDQLKRQSEEQLEHLTAAADEAKLELLTVQVRPHVTDTGCSEMLRGGFTISQLHRV